MHGKKKHPKSERQLVTEARFRDRMVANGWEPGWISDEILQKFMAAERNKTADKVNRKLVPGDYA